MASSPDMRDNDTSSCIVCRKSTKYSCIRCKIVICTNCSFFENDEEIDGWIIGKAVGYCRFCYEEIEDDHPVEVSPTTFDEPLSPTAPKELRKRKQRVATFLICEDSESENDTDNGVTHQPAAKKAANKTKVGRKGRWSNAALDDFIDIIANDETYKEKLIFRKPKNQQNSILYESIQKQLRSRCTERGEEFSFSIEQLRSKFKRYVGECKKAALTIKTASGVKRFQEDKGYGAWFNQLFVLVRSRDSCQPELAVEPSAKTVVGRGESSNDSNGVINKTAVRLKSKKQEQSNKATDAVSEVLSLLKSTIENDPMNEMITFMREELKENREHEKKLFEMLLQHNQQNQAAHFHPAVHGPSMPQWKNGFVNQLPTFPYSCDANSSQGRSSTNTSTPVNSAETGSYETETHYSF